MCVFVCVCVYVCVCGHAYTWVAGGSVHNYYEVTDQAVRRSVGF